MIYDTRQIPYRVNGLKIGRNNRTMFSKISLNLVIVGFVAMVTDNPIALQAVWNMHLKAWFVYFWYI